VMTPVLAVEGKVVPLGYRRLGAQGLRVDRAELLLREAHGRRVAAQMSGGRKAFVLDPAEALKIGFSTKSYAALLRLAGFRAIVPRALPQGALGPLAQVVWRWQPPRREVEALAAMVPVDPDSPFAALAALVA